MRTISATEGTGADDVYLRVGGVLFVTKQSTINTRPGTLLTELTPSSPYFHPESGEYRFDRDPDLFGHILNFYRWGELHVPSHVCAMGFRKELQFWRIPLTLVSLCCWKTFYKVENELGTMTKLKHETELILDYGRAQKVDPDSSFRMKFWLFLDEPNYSFAARIWHNAYLFLVIVSAVVYALWMLPSLRVSPYIAERPVTGSVGMDKVHDLLYTDPHPVLFVLDTICMFLFVVEFLLHFGICPDKTAFIKNWYNILSFFLLLTMVVSFVLEIRKDWITTEAVGVLYYVLKNFNLFRLLLLLRLEKQFVGLKILILAIQGSAKQLLLLGITLLVAVSIYAGLIFCAEIDETTFPTFFTAMWWALITMTTVGYGDYYPTDAAGYVIGSMCAMNGLLLIALPIAVIASNFAEYYECQDLHKSHIKISANPAAEQAIELINGPESKTADVVDLSPRPNSVARRGVGGSRPTRESWVD